MRFFRNVCCPWKPCLCCQLVLLYWDLRVKLCPLFSRQIRFTWTLRQTESKGGQTIYGQLREGLQLRDFVVTRDMRSAEAQWRAGRGRTKPQGFHCWMCLGEDDVQNGNCHLLSLPIFSPQEDSSKQKKFWSVAAQAPFFFGNAKHPFLRCFSDQRLYEALTLTFLAEWGDRSQISTIALAAAKDMDRKRLWEKHHDLNNWVWKQSVMYYGSITYVCNT